jgi:hypothetical protein
MEHARILAEPIDRSSRRVGRTAVLGWALTASGISAMRRRARQGFPRFPSARFDCYALKWTSRVQCASRETSAPAKLPRASSSAGAPTAMRASACSAARLVTIRSLHRTCSEHRRPESRALNCPDDQQIDEEQPNGEPQHQCLLRSCDERHGQGEQRHHHDRRPPNRFALPHARVFVRTLTMSEDDICNVCAARPVSGGVAQSRCGLQQVKDQARGIRFSPHPATGSSDPVSPS